jgi:hypothetical protein
MKLKKHLIVAVVLAIFSCKAQQVETTLLQVENHLNGALDYTSEALNLIQVQADGTEISLGKIDNKGSIHFNLPQYDIKTLFDAINLQHYNFYNWFLMDGSCKDRDVFAKTPFDAVYSQKNDAIYIKKYGINIAVLEAVSDKKMLNHDSPVIGSTYFWFYIDRSIDYIDKCVKTAYNTNIVKTKVSVNIPFKKGWNFIEKKQVAIKKYENSKITQPEIIQFSKVSPESKAVHWYLRQIQEDEKIATAKRLDKLTPITKKQFENWTPNKLGELSLTSNQYGNIPQGQKNKNNIHLIYTNKDQTKEIDLYVVDAAKNPDDLEMVNFAYAMENNAKDTKDIKPYVAQYKEQRNTTKLLYKVKDRIIVNALGKNMNPDELWSYIQKMQVKKLTP